MDTNEVARPDIERMAADDNSLSAHGVRILASAEQDRRTLLDYVRSLEAELDAIGKALMDFRPFRYQNMSNLEAVLDLIRDDDAQQGGGADGE